MNLFNLLRSRCRFRYLGTFPLKRGPNLKPAFAVRNFKLQMAEGNVASSKLDRVPAVDIEEGKFKYVLIKVYESKEEEEISKFIIRGYKWAGYHSDIYEQVDGKIHKLGLACECVGGGRIFHDPNKKSILVYGYSQGYGKADHSISTELLKNHYPNYEDISWSDEGY